jgi:pilus assembly protein TadC
VFPVSPRGWPTKQVVLAALLLTLVTFAVFGVVALLPEGPVQDVAEVLAGMLVGGVIVFMVLRAAHAWRHRIEDLSWHREE